MGTIYILVSPDKKNSVSIFHLPIKGIPNLTLLTGIAKSQDSKDCSSYARRLFCTDAKFRSVFCCKQFQMAPLLGLSFAECMR
jgi:hypothetical protein